MYNPYQHNTIFKSGWVVLQEEEKRVIDSNLLLERRLEEQENVLRRKRSKDEAHTGEDGFAEGVEALPVDALLSDREDEPAVIKAGADSGEEAMLLKEEARTELEEARREAERIRQRAMDEAEGIRQEAEAESRARGYEDGYNQGLAQIEEMKQELARREQEMQRRCQKMMDSLEPEFVETLTGIYEHIFHVDLQDHMEIIEHLIGVTLGKIEGSGDFLIHVSREDYPYLQKRKGKIQEAVLSANSTVEIVEDALLGKNECMIETDGGIFDCGLGTELEELRRKLKLLSYDGGGGKVDAN